ncbi:MAG: hotdog fold thioesterase [Gammaproteobacteria bacterium]|nr:hotdog fold thioesterase [Gammaproteobacteria bacterium]
MAIWKNQISLEEIEQYSKNTMVEYLDISVIEIGDDYIKASMPVCAKTHRPMGMLHGGASVALAETIGSFAAYMAALPGKHCVGLEVNANHIRSVESGLVYAVARPIHIGRSTQVWDVRISDREERTVSVARLTVAVLDGH